MKKRITLLTMTLLLAIVGAQAGTKDVFEVTTPTLDSPLTFSSESGYQLSLTNDNWKNATWNFAEAKDLSDYDRIGITVTASNNKNEIKLGISDGTTDYDVQILENGANISTTTTYSLFLQAAKDRGVNLNAVTKMWIHIWGDSRDTQKTEAEDPASAHVTTLNFSEIFFEKYNYQTLEDGNDYVQSIFTPQAINFTEERGLMLDGDKFQIALSQSWGSKIGYNFKETQDWSSYNYLVIVPRRPNGENSIDPCFPYSISDGTTTFNDADYRFGFWNQRRATAIPLDKLSTFYRVIGKNGNDTKEITGFGTPPTTSFSADNKTWDITSTTTYTSFDRSKIKQFYFGGYYNDPAKPMEISAIYLTNTAITSEGYGSGSNYTYTNSTDNKWATICLPFNAAVCGAYVYDVVGVDSKDNPEKLYLEEVKGVLKAGKAYVMQTTAAADVSFYKAGSDNNVAAATGNALTGNLSETPAAVPSDGTSYILKNGSWKCVNGTTNTVGANRAYLTLTEELVLSAEEKAKAEAEVSEARIITMSLGGGDITGIEEVSGFKLQVSSPDYYDLQGRRVSQPTKPGIYVKNGKKYIIK